MTDKLNDSILKLLARPGLASVRFFRDADGVHVEGVANNDEAIAWGVIVSDSGPMTLLDAVWCLDGQAWDGGDPPDQLAEVLDSERAMSANTTKQADSVTNHTLAEGEDDAR